MLKKKISKGSVIIYVLILAIPVLFATIVLLDLVSTDYLSENIVEKGNQAKYNAESGIAYGVKILQFGEFDVNYNYNTFYLFFDGIESVSNSINYSSITIKKALLGNKYTLHSEGHYMGIMNVIDITIDNNYMMNLSRKFSAVNISPLSNADFQISIDNSSIMLPEKNRFLILDGIIDTPLNIKLYSNIFANAKVQKDSDILFTNSCLVCKRIRDISTKETSRGMWKQSGNCIWYYVSKKNANIEIDLNSLLNSNEEFYSGFRNYSGTVTDDNKIINNNVRLIFVDGNMTIKNIKGNLIGNNLSISQRYLNNIVVYCNGKITIDDCVLAGYDGNKNLTDLNISFIANEIGFALSNELNDKKNIISYMKGNSGILIDKNSEIIELIKQNTSIYSDWWI